MSADKAKRNIYKGITYVLLIGIAILVAFPFLWMILSSFKDISEFYIMPPKLMPEAFKLDNYIELFGRGDFGRYYLNSIFITVVQVFGNLFIILPAAFAFAKYDFKGKHVIFLIILGTTMVPWVATIIPLYILAGKFRLIDTYLGLIIPGLADAFSIFLARNFISSIPDALLEAMNRWR